MVVEVGFTRPDKAPRRSHLVTAVEQEFIHQVRGLRPTLQVTAAVAESTRRDRGQQRSRQAMVEALKSINLHDDLQLATTQLEGEQDGGNALDPPSHLSTAPTKARATP